MGGKRLEREGSGQPLGGSGGQEKRRGGEGGEEEGPIMKKKSVCVVGCLLWQKKGLNFLQTLYMW